MIAAAMVGWTLGYGLAAWTRRNDGLLPVPVRWRRSGR